MIFPRESFVSFQIDIMAQSFSNKKSVIINASVDDVWKALTDPVLIKQYYLGVDTIGEWKEGNTIVFKGEWQGKKVEGKGKVLQLEDNKLLKHSYLSNISGLEDRPENYHIVTYELAPQDSGTKLTLTEENLQSKEMQEQSAKLWDMIFGNLKKLLESEKVG
jgi:uncharacterized protein YndB with AHSA1/START domain